jgi:acetyltransferase-like isoleucine patch superfamily enzyme
MDNLSQFVIKQPLRPRIWNYNVVPYIGENVKLQDVLLDCQAKITIHSDVFFGHGVRLLTGSHDYTKFGAERQKSIIAKEIIIHRGVWVASGATILGGVAIGSHSVIAAGSVVTRNVPEHEIWGGVPAKFIRRVE